MKFNNLKGKKVFVTGGSGVIGKELLPKLIDSGAIVFSGDLGRYNKPILRNPSSIHKADILLIESTYGNRDNKIDSPKEELAAQINLAMERDGCLMIPAFAVGTGFTVTSTWSVPTQPFVVPDTA